MIKHLPKIILLTIYPCFLWAGSAFLDLVPDTKEGFGNVKQRFAKLTDAANVYDFMRGTAFRGELSKEITAMDVAPNIYLNYLAAAYEGTAEHSIIRYITDITSAAKESKDSMLAIKLPEVVGSDFKIAQYLRWAIGPTLTGSTFQEVRVDIRRKLSFPFPGVTAQAYDLWAAILVSSYKLLGLKAISHVPMAISISFSRDTLPIIHAYNPVLAAAAKRRSEEASAVPAAGAGVRSSVGVAVAGSGGKGASGDGVRAPLLDKPAAGAGVVAVPGNLSASVGAVSSTEASAAVAGVAAALAGSTGGSGAARTLRRRSAAEEIEPGQASAGVFADSGAVALISKQDPPAPRCKRCTML